MTWSIFFNMSILEYFVSCKTTTEIEIQAEIWWKSQIDMLTTLCGRCWNDLKFGDKWNWNFRIYFSILLCKKCIFSYFWCYLLLLSIRLWQSIKSFVFLIQILFVWTGVEWMKPARKSPCLLFPAIYSSIISLNNFGLTQKLRNTTMIRYPSILTTKPDVELKGYLR